MLEFAQNWSWQVKSFVTMATALPIIIGMPMLQNRFGLRPESFFMVWFIGVSVSFVMAGSVSTTPISDYFTPLWLMLCVFISAMVLGGLGNILLIQAMSLEGVKPPSNSALPFAIIGLASSLAYVLSWLCGKIMPTIFPTVEFSLINLSGVVLIAIGATLVIYQKS